MKLLRGFTFIELVIVVIILGILAAFAVPKFVDLSNDAKAAATFSVATALSSANNVNYISRKENKAHGVSVTNCTSVTNALQGGLPSGYHITANPVAVDTTATCTLIGQSGTTATFSATGIL